MRRPTRTTIRRQTKKMDNIILYSGAAITFVQGIVDAVKQVKPDWPGWAYLALAFVLAPIIVVSVVMATTLRAGEAITWDQRTLATLLLASVASALGSSFLHQNSKSAQA